jgi:hypothetical protein
VDARRLHQLADWGSRTRSLTLTRQRSILAFLKIDCIAAAKIFKCSFRCFNVHVPGLADLSRNLGANTPSQPDQQNHQLPLSRTQLLIIIPFPSYSVFTLFLFLPASSSAAFLSLMSTSTLFLSSRSVAAYLPITSLSGSPPSPGSISG